MLGGGKAPFAGTVNGEPQYYYVTASANTKSVKEISNGPQHYLPLPIQGVDRLLSNLFGNEAVQDALLASTAVERESTESDESFKTRVIKDLWEDAVNSVYERKKDFSSVRASPPGTFRWQVKWARQEDRHGKTDIEESVLLPKVKANTRLVQVWNQWRQSIGRDALDVLQLSDAEFLQELGVQQPIGDAARDETGERDVAANVDETIESLWKTWLSHMTYSAAEVHLALAPSLSNLQLSTFPPAIRTITDPEGNDHDVQISVLPDMPGIYKFENENWIFDNNGFIAQDEISSFMEKFVGYDTMMDALDSLVKIYAQNDTLIEDSRQFFATRTPEQKVRHIQEILKVSDSGSTNRMVSKDTVEKFVDGQFMGSLIINGNRNVKAYILTELVSNSYTQYLTMSVENGTVDNFQQQFPSIPDSILQQYPALLHDGLFIRAYSSLQTKQSQLLLVRELMKTERPSIVLQLPYNSVKTGAAFANTLSVGSNTDPDMSTFLVAEQLAGFHPTFTAESRQLTLAFKLTSSITDILIEQGVLLKVGNSYRRLPNFCFRARPTPSQLLGMLYFITAEKMPPLLLASGRLEGGDTQSTFTSITEMEMEAFFQKEDGWSGV